jgi:hypothetical protein
MKKTPGQPAAEIDERFPSGTWTGFWIQDGVGKQPVELSLFFAAGSVTGAGTDMVGKFTYRGTYAVETGRCLMVKKYAWKHSVTYEGVNDGSPLWLWGTWNIRGIFGGIGDTGGFHIWPQGEPDPTQRRLAAELKLPEPVRRRRVRVPSDLLPH